MSKDREINIAFLGCGNIAHAHLVELQKIPGVKIKACWNRREEAALGKQFQAVSGAEYCAEDYRQIAEDPEIDAVYICTMQNFRIPLLEVMAKHRKAIFMEKPLALRREEFQELARIFRRYPVLFQSGYKLRYNSLMEYVAKRQFHPETIFCQVADQAWADNSPTSDINVGGGHILSQGVYAAETMRLLAGATPVEVSAMAAGSTRNAHLHGSLVANFRFANGVIGSLLITDTGIAAAPVSKFFAEASGHQKNLLILDRFTRLVETDTDGNREEFHFSEDGFQRQSVAFLNHVRQGTAPECSFWEGIYPSLMIHRAVEAAAAQVPLKLDPKEWLAFSSVPAAAGKNVIPPINPLNLTARSPLESHVSS